MTLDESHPESERNAWDGLTQRLQAYRKSVGNPSYATIAARISDQRIVAGMNEHAARVPRSTVYDSFRVGRARPNFDFVREIGAALGADVEQVNTWITDCHHHETNEHPPPQPVEPAPVRQVLLLMAVCVGFNMFGRLVVDWLHLPIYLDMWGTAIAALALGPWRGAFVGGVTNVIGAIGSGWVSLPFAVVNIAGALVWGYGARRYNMTRTLPRYLLLNVLVAVACTLIAVPILVLVFDGSVGQGQDTITQTFLDLTHRLTAAVGLSNMLTSLIDKVLSGFVALVAVTALPMALRHDLKMFAVVPVDSQ